MDQLPSNTQSPAKHNPRGKVCHYLNINYNAIENNYHVT